MTIAINRCTACGSTDSSNCCSPNACTPDDPRLKIGDRMTQCKHWDSGFDRLHGRGPYGPVAVNHVLCESQARGMKRCPYAEHHVPAVWCDWCKKLTPESENRKLDGDDLCPTCANLWALGEGIAAQEREKESK